MTLIKDDVIVNKVPAFDDLYGGSFAGHPASFVKVTNKVEETHSMLRAVNRKAHHNILSFWGTHLNGDHYFIFQPFQFRVIDYIGESGPEAWQNHVDSLKDDFLGILKGVVDGMDCLHQLGISHGNLDPWTTYVDEFGCLKIGGLDTCSKLTKEMREKDFQQAAKYFAFLFSDMAGNPITKEQYANATTQHIISRMYRTAAEAKKVVNMLMTADGARTDIWSKLLILPWIWPAEKRLLFFKLIQEILCDSFETYAPEVHKLKIFINGFFNQCCPYRYGWVEAFGGCIMEVQDPYDAQNPQSQKYMADSFTCYHRRQSLVGLINFIGNLYSHHFEIGQKLTRRFGAEYNDLGDRVEDLEFLCRSLFPDLLITVYAGVENNQLNNTIQLRRFYLLAN